MRYITGFDRDQTVLFPATLEESIDENNPTQLDYCPVFGEKQRGGMIFLIYNIAQVLRILGLQELKKRLEECFSHFQPCGALLSVF